MPLPEPNPIQTLATCGLAYPLVAVSSCGEHVGTCYRLTGNSHEFKVDRDCRVTHIIDSNGRTQHRCDNPIRKGQLLLWILSFSSL